MLLALMVSVILTNSIKLYFVKSCSREASFFVTVVSFIEHFNVEFGNVVRPAVVVVVFAVVVAGVVAAVVVVAADVVVAVVVVVS